MDHYEVRKYPAWDHPILGLHARPLLSLAPQDKAGEKAPHIRLSQMRILLEVALLLREYDIHDVLDLVEWIQRRNYRSYISHRKGKMRANGYVLL